MGAASYAQNSFLGGEWSKAMQGRFDRPDYRTGMNVCKNGVPTDTGAWVRRPGTAFIHPTFRGRPARILPFHFKNASPYTMEFTENVIQAYAGPNILEHNITFPVASISSATPPVVTTSIPHDFLNTGMDNQDCFFTGLGTSCPLLQRRIFKVVYISSTTFSIFDQVSGVSIVGADIGTLPAGVVVHHVTEFATAFNGDAWSRVRSVQAETKAVLLEGSTVPQVFEAVTPPTSTAFATFTLGTAPLSDGPYLKPIPGSWVTPNALNGLLSLTLSFQTWDSTRAYNLGDYVNSSGVNYKSLVDFNVGYTPASNPSFWVSVNGGTVIGPNGLQTSDVGRHVRLFSEPPAWAVGSTYAAKDVVGYNGAYWISLGASTGTIPGTDATKWLPYIGAQAARWTWGKITAVSGTGLISPALSGVVNIGNMTGGGALAAAFDGTLNKTAANSASGICEDVTPPDWTPGLIYNAGAVVSYIGYTWIASAPTTPPWGTGVYNVNDIITYNGQYYVCTGVPAAWAANVVYAVGNPVSYNGVWYHANVPNLQSPPGTVPNAWLPGITPGSSGSEAVWAFGVRPGTNNSYWNTHTLAATPYVGQNFTTPGAQTIAQATVFPSTDKRFTDASTVVTVRLYASNSAPTSPINGTLLGTTVSSNNVGSISVPSSDAATTFKYVWVTIQATQNNAGQQPATVYISQVQFYSPNVVNGTVFTVQIEGDALLYSTTIKTWRLGVYSNTTGWPTCGTYHRGRLWLGGVVPNRVDSSNAGGSTDLFNFAPTAPDGTVSDSNSITAQFAADDVNPTFWMVSDLQGIICGTQGGEFLVFAPTQGAITPTNIAADRVTKIGCANIEPKKTGLTLAFVQTHKRKLMEYFSDVISGKFASPNLSLSAKHLMQRQIAEIAYQSESIPVVWARMLDGSLLGCTYKRESLLTAQGPLFSGWHQHTLGSSRVIESMCIGPSADGTLGTLTMVTNDLATGIRHVEYLTDFVEEDSAATDAWHLDNAVAPTAMQDVTISSVTYLQLMGLWHLAGKTVTVFAGGLDVGDYTVAANGTINVPYGAVALFTQAFVAAFSGTMPVVVGFTFTSDGQCLRPAAMAESGARNGPALGKKRRTHQFAALLNSTQAISFGTDFSKLFPAMFRDDMDTAFAPNALWSGVFWTSLADDYSYDSMLAWRITRPYPAIMCAIEGFIETQDK